MFIGTAGFGLSRNFDLPGKQQLLPKIVFL